MAGYFLLVLRYSHFTLLILLKIGRRHRRALYRGPGAHFSTLGSTTSSIGIGIVKPLKPLLFHQTEYMGDHVSAYPEMYPTGS